MLRDICNRLAEQIVWTSCKKTAANIVICHVSQLWNMDLKVFAKMILLQSRQIGWTSWIKTQQMEWSTINSAQLNSTPFISVLPKNDISSRMDVILNVSPVLSLGWRVWTDHKENVEANGWQNDITCSVPACLKLWDYIVQTEKYGSPIVKWYCPNRKI